jgi:hypothetical protein
MEHPTINRTNAMKQLEQSRLYPITRDAMSWDVLSRVGPILEVVMIARTVSPNLFHSPTMRRIVIVVNENLISWTQHPLLSFWTHPPW